MNDTKLVSVALMVLMVGTIGDIIVTKKLCTNSGRPLCQPVKMAGIVPQTAVIQPHKPNSAQLHPQAPTPKRLFWSVWVTKKSRTRAVSTLMI